VSRGELSDKFVLASKGSRDTVSLLGPNGGFGRQVRTKNARPLTRPCIFSWTRLLSAPAYPAKAEIARLTARGQVLLLAF